LNTFSIDENWSRISENKKKSKSQIMAMGKMVRDSREKKCMPCVVARIYIVLLVVLERGVRVRRNCNIFNQEDVCKIILINSQIRSTLSCGSHASYFSVSKIIPKYSRQADGPRIL
jgi:hypothetical protein